MDESDLTFLQRGSELVVQLTVTVNNSDHVTWTNAIVQSPNVVPANDSADNAVPKACVNLEYFVFQNRDRFVRSQKNINITWRLPQWTRGTESYVVAKAFTPTTNQWTALLPQLRELMRS